MLTEAEIKQRISAFLAREESLASLERWLNSSSQNLVVDNSDNAIKLLAAVNLLISENHDNVIDDHQLRLELARLRGPYAFHLTVRIEFDRAVPAGIPEAEFTLSQSHALSF